MRPLSKAVVGSGSHQTARNRANVISKLKHHPEHVSIAKAKTLHFHYFTPSSEHTTKNDMPRKTIVGHHRKCSPRPTKAQTRKLGQSKKTCSTAQLGARDINLHGPEQALARFDAQLFGTFKMDLLAYIRHSLVSANNCPALSKRIYRTKTDTRPVQRVSATQNNRTMDTRIPSQRCNPMHARSNVHFSSKHQSGKDLRYSADRAYMTYSLYVA